ncbi:DNA polymerase III subunit alpha [Halobacillus sp. BBL2006]|uniref:DNA polymerase III subunit alpha n=1 Tax=Halobacillus sp. BBL2006 TaxID=1543706 RepID=UPI000543B7A0|nr:DNA polymerase III subunit alpha [Halobacillus sp. BBL2006]KHE72405.1 DNA polymerase III subunit alpha [Halobacillus sp. BBL2006]
MAFTHLHIQSGYSLMDSTIKVNDLVMRAKNLGYHSLALTDKGIMSGSVSFYEACKTNGIKPIIGLKVDVLTDTGSIPTLFLAKNHFGYQNLMKISSWIHTKNEKIPVEQLKGFSTGLISIVLTSMSSIAESIANWNFIEAEKELQPLFQTFQSDDVYLSIQDRDLHSKRQLHKPLKEWSDQEKIKVVALGDVRYLERDDATAYLSLRAIDEGSRLPSSIESNHQFLKSPEEMEAFFKDWWPEVIEQTEVIAKKCDVELDLSQQLLPSYPAPAGEEPGNYLRGLCMDALEKKYINNREAALQRLDHELNIIDSMGFNDYFLIVWDFIAYARDRGIQAGPGRGSAAGSIVAYLLDITQVDPLAYGLLFERFLNPERITMPDIDIDFPDHRRDEVIDYVAEKYGKRHVAQICTFGTFAARSVLRDLFKVMAIDDSDAAFILKQIPKSANDSLVQIVQKSVALKDYIRNSDRLKRLFKVATKLEGLPRHVSTHAAGVVISEQPLVQYTALMRGQGNVNLTQLAMGELEKVGLLKIDFLGLRNLTFIEKIENKIRRFKDSDFSITDVPFDDSETFTLLKEGKTNGVFQLESQGMKSVLTRLKPSHFEDIVAVNALYRPGPMDYIQTYIDRKENREKVQYPHPDIEPILKHTYGVLIYQEQIMQVAQKIAGYKLGEADLLRRAVSKKQAEILNEERENFVRKASLNGYSERVSNQLFDWIVKFSNYGFNRSHAVAYSFIAYWLAYMKAHYPSYFLAELINAHMGDRDKLAAYIREAKEFKTKVKAPSINNSQIFCKDENGSIRMGLLAIKGVGFQAAQAILEERQHGRFKHLNDFCLRVGSKAVNRSVIESLVLAGAFDEVQSNRAILLASIDQALEQGELFKEFHDQPGLFEADLDLGDQTIEAEPFPVLKKLAMEKEVLGTYLSNHPLEVHRTQLRSKGVVPVKQAFYVHHNRSLQVAAVIETIKEIRTKRGDPMSFVTISDETGEMDVVLFPELYRSVKTWLSEQMLVFIKGKVEERRNTKQMIASDLTAFESESFQQEPDQRLFVRVEKSKENEAIEKLKKMSAYFPGNTPVLIVRSDDRKTYQLGETYALDTSRECLTQLNQYFGSDSVALRAYKK